MTLSKVLHACSVEISEIKIQIYENEYEFTSLGCGFGTSFDSKGSILKGTHLVTDTLLYKNIPVL